MSPDTPARRKYPFTLRIFDDRTTLHHGFIGRGETIRQVAERMGFHGINEKSKVTLEGSEYYGKCGQFRATFSVDLS